MRVAVATGTNNNGCDIDNIDDVVRHMELEDYADQQNMDFNVWRGKVSRSLYNPLQCWYKV